MSWNGCLAGLILLDVLHASAFSPSMGVRRASLAADATSNSPPLQNRRAVIARLSAFAVTTSCWPPSPAEADAVCVSDCGSEGNPRYIDQQMSVPTDTSGNPRTSGFFLKRFTGDSTPFKFPQTPIRLIREWPVEEPFSKRDFSRMDESDDSSFYGVPRFVYHIDESSVAALTQYYRRTIPLKSDILDICSSWVSHYPLEFKQTMSRISGTGMNNFELRANNQLSDFKDKNLNIDPQLPYEDGSFDIVTCVVSIDYLINPIKVLKEAHRVLRPGGRVIISQSNRCFPTKAISMWLEMNDRQHLELINSYFQYAGGYKERAAFDISAKGGGATDPMFIIDAQKM